jgi:peptidoglycan hydrolase-like protein with peptidoglycan-binding domain
MGRLVKLGSKGADVRAIQDVLNFHVRRLSPLKVDGDLGPRTHARVIEFQRSNQLQPDGVVGPKTLGKLFEEEALPISFALLPQLASANGMAPPRLIPPLTLPPRTPPLVTTPFRPGGDIPHDRSGAQ